MIQVLCEVQFSSFVLNRWKAIERLHYFLCKHIHLEKSDHGKLIHRHICTWNWYSESNSEH